MTDGISRLVLYEPGILEGVTGYYSSDRIAAALRETEDHIEAGRTEEGLVTFLRGVIDMSAADIEMMRSMPTWRNRLAAAHTLTREIRGEASWLFDPAKYRGMTVPTLLLTGSDTFQTARDGTYALHEALPNSRVAVMEGQGHAAMTSAPDLFVREVLDFLLETWPGRTEPR